MKVIDTSGYGQLSSVSNQYNSRKYQMYFKVFIKLIIILTMIHHVFSYMKVNHITKRNHNNILYKLFSTSNNDLILNSPSRYKLYKALKTWRLNTSNELQRPPYAIFTNKVLDALVMIQPKTINEFISIKGIGPKTSQYADNILTIINSNPYMNDTADLIELTDYMKSKSISKAVSKENTIDSKKDNKQISKNKLNQRSKEVLYNDLTIEQQIASKRALEGHNIFITGSAGTGKSYLLNYIIQELENKFGDNSVAVTAPTGVAAVNINGQTIHGFAGIGIGKESHEELIDKILKSKKTCKRWKNTDVLVIDEISMVDKNLFELLDKIAKAIKGNSKPFGGIQLIVVGDFLQLPPIESSNNRRFCFQSDIWIDSQLNKIENQINLKEIRRQNNEIFINILNDIRIGKLTENNKQLLDDCLVATKPLPDDGIIPTKLYCINKDVDSENNIKLNSLKGEKKIFKAKDRIINQSIFRNDKYLMDLADKTIPREIELKVGAQVMLLRNINSYDYINNFNSKLVLVNGSRGVIQGFTKSTIDNSEIPLVRFDNGKILPINAFDFTVRSPDNESELTRTQIPLKLAWAMTIHKSQGCTLTRAELMISNSFDYGQTYVALSRVTSLNGLWLTNPITNRSVKAHPDVLQHFNYA